MPQVARKDRLNVKEAAEYLGIDPRTLRRYRQQGRVRTRRTPGGLPWFSRTDLDKAYDNYDRPFKGAA